MIIESEAVGPFFKNGFVVGCEETREAVLIDPGDEVATLLASAERLKLTIRRILLTHAHVDHVTGVAAAKRALGVPIHLHRDDQFLYDHAVQAGAMFGLKVEPQPPIDLYYAPDEVIAFGGYEVRPLSGVTSSLGLAFNSTLVALVLSMVLMYMLHMLQSRQEALILELQNYCREKLVDIMKVPLSEQAASPSV